MSQTFTSLLTHIVFSTKDRRPLIDPEIKRDLYPYVGGIIRGLRGKALAVNGASDHLHLLVSLHPAVSISEAVRVVKSNSTGWVHDKWARRVAFGWQTGYAAFSVSKSNVNSVTAYIAGQERHHRKMTFQEELIALLERHEIEYDARFIWP